MYTNPERLQTLLEVLQFCTRKKAFTAGERICINQERAKLLEQQRDIENPDELTAPNFEHSKQLTAKIDFIILKIEHEQNLKNGN